MVISVADVVPDGGEVIRNFWRGLQPAPELLVPLLVLAAFVLVMRRPRA